ncbi:hypothetical protein GGS23DRAFT_596439 [Durotheca rogersii]|uniref:uncharacterized protein n=1 Tax=Durotheca rogersii TaxID=419775 RepID=UPI00221E63DF|nr:uncharacterized protein GGS23DRAFT_596439 [Durotheca rogersii]KAI5863955.1 hypothetical protein GGS23DRAFT_596439 [Durotheca rogersii]
MNVQRAISSGVLAVRYGDYHAASLAPLRNEARNIADKVKAAGKAAAAAAANKEAKRHGKKEAKGGSAQEPPVRYQASFSSFSSFTSIRSSPRSPRPRIPMYKYKEQPMLPSTKQPTFPLTKHQQSPSPKGFGPVPISSAPIFRPDSTRLTMDSESTRESPSGKRRGDDDAPDALQMTTQWLDDLLRKKQSDGRRVMSPATKDTTQFLLNRIHDAAKADPNTREKLTQAAALETIRKQIGRRLEADEKYAEARVHSNSRGRKVSECVGNAQDKQRFEFAR